MALDEARTPGSPLYGHRPRFKRIFRGEDSAGEHAWVAQYAAGGSLVCVRIRGENAPFSVRYEVEVDRCPDERDGGPKPV